MLLATQTFTRMYKDRFAYDLNNNPVLFNILKSYVCFENDELKDYSQIIDQSRQYLFENYPLSDKVNKSQFEQDIIIMFMNRRIEEETYVMFKLKFNAKLRSIMPKYNLLFDGLSQNFYEQNSGTTEKTTDIFKENVKENSTDNRIINTTDNKTTDKTDNRTVGSNEISDRRKSDTPQNALADVRNGTYVSEYNYDTGSLNTTDNNTTHSEEESNIHTTDNDTLNKNQDTANDRDIEKKIIKTDTINRDQIYLNIEQYGHIMELIYNDLEVCFLSTD